MQEIKLFNRLSSISFGEGRLALGVVDGNEIVRKQAFNVPLNAQFL